MVIKVWKKSYFGSNEFYGIKRVNELKFIEESYDNFYKKTFPDRSLDFLYFEGKMTLKYIQMNKYIICPPIVAIFLLTFQKDKLTTTINEFYSKLCISCQDETKLKKRIQAYITKLLSKKNSVCVSNQNKGKKIEFDSIITFKEERLRVLNNHTTINPTHTKKKISGKKSSTIDDERENQYLFILLL